jgi:hypothetical protein
MSPEPMTLFDYLRAEGRSQVWLAKQIGYCPCAISHIKQRVREGRVAPPRFVRACEILLGLRLSGDLWVLQQEVEWAA